MAEETQALQETQETEGQPAENTQPGAVDGIQPDKPSAEAKKYEAEIKKLKSQLDDVKRERMTEEERKAADIREREENLAQRERELADAQNRMYAVKALKKAGLDDGGDSALALLDLLMSGAPDDEAEIESRIKAFTAYQKQHDKALTEKLFKGAGRAPEKGGDASPQTVGRGALAAQKYAKKLKINTEG